MTDDLVQECQKALDDIGLRADIVDAKALASRMFNTPTKEAKI
jgi:hypothetical protein